MCTGMETMMIGQTAATGLSQYIKGSTQADLAKADAESERLAASRQAERIARATRTQRGAAAAATAANGTRLDQFSLINDKAIAEAGATDAGMAILSGNNRARSLELQGSMAQRDANSALAGSLFQGAYQYMKGWKGTQTPMTQDEFMRAEKRSY